MLFFAAASLLSPVPSARAATWPGGPVIIIMPCSVGNGASLLADLQARFFTLQTGQRFDLEYIPGRGGLDAWATTDSAIADGSELTLVELPGFLLRILHAPSGLSAGALVPCHISAYSPLALWVPTDSPFATLEDFIAAAKSQPRTLQVAGPGTFTAAQLAALRFDRLAGIQTLYMPVMGEIQGADAIRQSGMAAFWAEALAYPALVGGYRPLAVAGETRSSVFPDVPTFREREFDLVEGNYRGYMVGADTEGPLREAIFLTFEAIRADPRFVAEAAAFGFTILDVPEAGFQEFLDNVRADSRAKAENLGVF